MKRVLLKIQNLVNRLFTSYPDADKVTVKNSLVALPTKYEDGYLLDEQLGHQLFRESPSDRTTNFVQIPEGAVAIRKETDI